MSSCLAPWLETMIPEAPHSAASFASLGAKIPFNTIGRVEFLHVLNFKMKVACYVTYKKKYFFIQMTSSQVKDSSNKFPT